MMDTHELLRMRRLGRISMLSFLLLIGGGLSHSAMAQDWTLDWYTIDGGGVLESETADKQWQLSGTIGQWDSTSSQALSASGVRLTGGFWAFLVNPIDAIFRDRFDAPVIPRRYEIDSEQDN